MMRNKAMSTIDGSIQTADREDNTHMKLTLHLHNMNHDDATKKTRSGFWVTTRKGKDYFRVKIMSKKLQNEGLQQEELENNGKLQHETQPSEDEFSDTLDGSQLDAIVEQGHRNAEEMSHHKAKHENQRRVYGRGRSVQVMRPSTPNTSITLRFTGIVKLFKRPQHAEMKTLANYSRKMLERRIRLLVVALNMLLEGSPLPEVLKKELGKTHECLIENITKMPLSIMREFVHRMHGYFLSLYDVIKDNDFGHLPNVPTIPVSEPKQTVEKKNQPPKHTPKRKRGRPKKPKLPYQRYHFPIPVDGLTTFDSLDNTNRDGSDDDLVEESMVMSLLDPISGHRLITPLRTRFCSHLQCFDMESFLELNNLRPFKVGIRRERPLPNGKPNVAAIFRDTQRRPLNPEIHNKMTPDFGYKTRYKHNLEQRKYNNNLLFFKCPICRLEFNIKDPGDVYVVGDLVDLLFDLDQTGHGNVEKVRISKDGTWSPIIEEETKEIEESKVVEIDLDDLTSEEEVTVKKEGEVNDKDETTENNVEKDSEKEETTENNADKTIEANANETSSDTDVEVNDAEETDNWSDESRELDRAMDTALGPDDPYRGFFAQQMGIPVRVGIQQQKRYVTPPPPPSVYPPAQRIRLRDILMHQSQDAYYGNGRWNSQPSKMYEGQLHQQNLRRSATYGPPRNDHQNDGPVFFTGNGEEDDPFVID